MGLRDLSLFWILLSLEIVIFATQEQFIGWPVDVCRSRGKWQVSLERSCLTKNY